MFDVYNISLHGINRLLQNEQIYTVSTGEEAGAVTEVDIEVDIVGVDTVIAHTEGVAGSFTIIQLCVISQTHFDRGRGRGY